MAEMIALVRFTVEGFHYWPEPHMGRAYLGTKHRHLFHMEVRIEVFHDEREIEYHDLLEVCKYYFPGGDMGGASCETMARGLAQILTARYPKRWLQVSCLEDNEVGAVFTLRSSQGDTDSGQ